jgi:transposase
MEQLIMSRKERERLVVFGRVKEKELSRREAAEVLRLSLRQVHRLYRRYVVEGDWGLIHRSRGRASPHRIESAECQRALVLYRDKYRGWGPTQWSEKLGEDHGIWVSHDTARRWLIGEGLLERGRRGRRSRRRRPRKERLGQMVQMDGSPHAWFGARGQRCVLMVMIDDATGRMLGRFHAAETMWAAMDLFGRWCGTYGIPQSLYVDRSGIYRSDREATVEEVRARRAPLTQFGRAMKELDVRLILARSPQAKGRVERANRTLQERLARELALAGVGTVESANAWLEQSGFFAKLNERFQVPPLDGLDAHRPVVSDLEQVLCVKEQRSVSLDGCVQWRGRHLQVRDQRPGLRQVEVWEHPDERVELLDGGRRLSWDSTPSVRPKVKKPITNNKRYKPGPHQQLRLGRALQKAG